MRFTSRPAILPASLVAVRCASLKYAGTVITASVTFSPRKSSAASLSFCRIMAEISGGGYSLPLAYLAHQTLAALGDPDDRRSRARTFLVGNYGWFAALHHCYHRIRRTQVNSYNLAHRSRS